MRAILEETSAEKALEETAALAGRFRYPNSEGFFDAAEHVAARARALGLQNVRIERFPARGVKWDPVEATLERVEPDPALLATLERSPLLLAQRSRAGDVSAALADETADVKGKIALTTRPPQAAWPELSRRGAVALLSAWRPDYFGRKPALDAVAWGEAPENALAFMISPKMGEELRARLARGPLKLRMRARVKSGAPGEIGQVMGELPGETQGEDIVLAAHLDHQKQGANDNASGSGALLEALRVARRLIAEGKAPRPRRTLRFWWSTEIASEREYFKRHPEEARRISLAIVLDQAGGELGKVNNFILIANPEWRAAWTDDLMRDLTTRFAETYAPAEHEPDPLSLAPGGGRQAMRNVYWDYQPLSDHVAFVACDVGVPSIALAVPSLDVIHTDQDTMERLDATWMKRSIALTLAPALWAASAGAAEANAVADAVLRGAVGRLAEARDREEQLAIERRRLESVASLDRGVDVAERLARLRAVVRALGPQAQTR